MSLQHIVLFSFTDELDASDEHELFTRVREWPGRIGGIDAIRLGRSISLDRTRGYQYLLYMELADEAALGDYQRHPVHRDFGSWVVDKGGAALAFDYHLDASTVIHPPLETTRL